MTCIHAAFHLCTIEWLKTNHRDANWNYSSINNPVSLVNGKSTFLHQNGISWYSRFSEFHQSASPYIGLHVCVYCIPYVLILTEHVPKQCHPLILSSPQSWFWNIYQYERSRSVCKKRPIIRPGVMPSVYQIAKCHKLQELWVAMHI